MLAIPPRKPRLNQLVVKDSAVRQLNHAASDLVAVVLRSVNGNALAQRQRRRELLGLRPVFLALLRRVDAIQLHVDFFTLAGLDGDGVTVDHADNI
jgi:hypothetical protein